MSASGGSGRDKTADELLAQLLTEREHVMVLEYSRANGLESDNAVFFLVALLKVYAHVHQQIMKAIEFAELGRSEMEATVNLSGQALEEKIEEQVAIVKHAFSDMNNIMGYHAAQFAAVAGEIKGLKEELEKLNKEAVGTFRAYKRIVDDGSGTTLSQMFQKAALEALDRRVPFFDDTIRTLILDTIARETRKLVMMVGCQFVILAILVFIFRR